MGTSRECSKGGCYNLSPQYDPSFYRFLCDQSLVLSNHILVLKKAICSKCSGYRNATSYS